jgi:hypothetical protein
MRPRLEAALLRGQRDVLEHELREANHLLQHVILHVARRHGVVIDMDAVIGELQVCSDRQHPAVQTAETVVAEAHSRYVHPTNRVENRGQ